jgi:hypothetical protein
MKIQEVLHEQELQEAGKIKTTLGAIALALGLGTADLSNASQHIQIPNFREQIIQARNSGILPHGKRYELVRKEGGIVTQVKVDGVIYDIKDKVSPLFKQLIVAYQPDKWKAQIRQQMANDISSKDPILIDNLYPEDTA